jgi:2-methylcitrate dehydratase PrpD
MSARTVSDAQLVPDSTGDVLALERLATLAARTSYDQSPAEVRERVVALVLDTLAVTSVGARRAELVAVRDVVTRRAARGAATVFGEPLPRPASMACTLNGSAAAADQLQDGHREARGHPASHVVLAVMAVAEETGASTKELLSAVLAGYEVGARLGRAMGGTPTGVHDIGTWGAVAAAAGTARLLRPHDVAAMRRAIELGASALLLTDATTIFTGHTGGHAFLGASVAHGLWLGEVACAGLEAAPGALDRFFGDHAARDWQGLPDVHDAADAAEGAWPDYEVLRGYVKLHPTCAHLHGVLDALADAMTQLRDQGCADPLASRVSRVEVRTYAAAAAFSDVAGNELQARFSIPTAVALALVHGGLDEALTDARVGAPAVRQLAQQVEVVADPALEGGYPSGRPSWVTLFLHGGSSVSATSLRPRGDADGALGRQAITRKRDRLLHEAFGDGAEALATVLEQWPSRHTPVELGAAFRQAAESTGGLGR